MAAGDQIIIVMGPGWGGGWFPRPWDWHPNSNSVQCIGAGGWGASSGPYDANYWAQGGGGAGGAFAVAYNVNPTSWPVAMTWGTPGHAQTSVANDGVPTSFGSLCSAASGKNGSPAYFGGASGNLGGADIANQGYQTWPNGYHGGHGGTAGGGTYSTTLNTTFPSGSGGGAAGPHGAGLMGCNIVGNSGGWEHPWPNGPRFAALPYPNYGGWGDAGWIGGGADNSPGQMLSWWQSGGYWYGPGSGAGRANPNLGGSAYGQSASYWGGGGGGGATMYAGVQANWGWASGGAGGQPLIIVAWTSLPPTSAGQVSVMA